jgi:hypothetical protein
VLPVRDLMLQSNLALLETLQTLDAPGLLPCSSNHDTMDVVQQASPSFLGASRKQQHVVRLKKAHWLGHHMARRSQFSMSKETFGTRAARFRDTSGTGRRDPEATGETPCRIG